MLVEGGAEMLSTMMSLGDTVCGVAEVRADVGSLLMASKEPTLEKSRGSSKKFGALPSVAVKSAKLNSVLVRRSKKGKVSGEPSDVPSSGPDGDDVPSECEGDVGAMFWILPVLWENKGTGGLVRGELFWLFKLVEDVGADDA